LPTRTRFVIEHHILRVGELLVVVEKEFSTEAGNGVGVRVGAESPASDVDVMNAVIAGVAGAEREEPAPGRGQHVGLIRLERSRAEPQIIIELGWRSAGSS